MNAIQVTLAGVLVVLASILGSLLVGLQHATPTTLGSVAVSNDYFATTTRGALGAGDYLITYDSTMSTSSLKRTGTFGSVVVTAAGSKTEILFWDATTTSTTGNNARSVDLPTSTLKLLGSLPPSATPGTYTFDVGYQYGILMVVSGSQTSIPTTTITWR